MAPSGTAARVRFEREFPPAALPVDDADWLAAWPAWLASCRALTAARRPHRDAWTEVCAQAMRLGPTQAAQVRAYFMARMDQYRVLAPGDAGQPARDLGLMTGYYEPQVEARSRRGGAFVVPLYRLPAHVPTAPRAELEASRRLRGEELIWLRDPVEAFFVEVQGSARVRLDDERWVRLAYAGSNGQPYRSIGRWLVEHGELAREQVSMQAIADWARAHPARVRELLDQNPRMVFFRAQALGTDDPGPVGTLGVALTPGVSVAVDPAYLPLGAPLLLQLAATGDGGGTGRGAGNATGSGPANSAVAVPSASAGPASLGAVQAGAGDAVGSDTGNALDAAIQALEARRGARERENIEALFPARPAIAQDTGGAIRGPLRIDWYWGQGPEAGAIAGRQHALGSVRLLVPRGVDPASLLGP